MQYIAHCETPLFGSMGKSISVRGYVMSRSKRICSYSARCGSG